MSEVINIKELNERIERESVFVDTLRTEHNRINSQRQPDEDQRQCQKTVAFPALVDKISILHIRKF